MDNTRMLLSLVVTWTVGLIPPLMIRYVFIKRSIQHGASIAIVFVFLVANNLLSVVLGSTSKTHAIWIIIAFISYSILTRETKIPRVKTDVARDELDVYENVAKVDQSTSTVFTRNHQSLDLLAQRTKAKIVIIFSLIAGISNFAVLVGADYKRALDSIELRSVERQALRYLKEELDPLDQYEYDFSDMNSASYEFSGKSAPISSPINAASPQQICADKVAAIIGAQSERVLYSANLRLNRELRKRYWELSSKGTSEIIPSSGLSKNEIIVALAQLEEKIKSQGKLPTLTDQERRLLLAEKDCKFVDSSPAMRDYFEFLSSAMQSMFTSITVFLGLAGIFWTLSYPHLGWKRLAITAACISSLIAFGVAGNSVITDGRMDGWKLAMVPISFVGVPLLLLNLRNAWLWIQRGF